MADRPGPNYVIEVERLKIDNMNLEVNLRKADFRKLEIDEELRRLDLGKESTRNLISENNGKIKEYGKLLKELSESKTKGV